MRLSGCKRGEHARVAAGAFLLGAWVGEDTTAVRPSRKDPECAEDAGEAMNLIEIGDCREIIKLWKSKGVQVQTCVTSPPYFGLRDYGVAGQIGLERNVADYISGLVGVFRSVREVLADDGTLWLNLGDSYAASSKGSGGTTKGTIAGGKGQSTNAGSFYSAKFDLNADGLKPKDLIGVPWRVALALQADGWYLRQDIIWAKTNPMPESVRDRCTKSHEYIFLLSKSPKYYFDADAISEPCVRPDEGKRKTPVVFGGRDKFEETQKMSRLHSGNEYLGTKNGMRNRRDVWTISLKPFKGSHFAAFPPDLIEPCILAGSRPNDIILDPFMGSGTVAGVALKLGRQYIGCEINPEYEKLWKGRIESITHAR